MGHHHDHQDYQLHQSDNRNDLNGDVSLGLGSTSSQLVKIGVSGSTLFQVLAIIMMMRMIELMIITMIVTVISDYEDDNGDDQKGRCQNPSIREYLVACGCILVLVIAITIIQITRIMRLVMTVIKMITIIKIMKMIIVLMMTLTQIMKNDKKMMILDDILVQAQNRRRPSRGLLVRMAL